MQPSSRRESSCILVSRATSSSRFSCAQLTLPTTRITAPDSLPSELRGPLLQEREHSLGEVGRLALGALGVRLGLELLGHPGVDAAVEERLEVGVGAGWAGGEAGEQLAALALERIVGDDAVDEAPVERLRRRDLLAEHP